MNKVKIEIGEYDNITSCLYTIKIYLCIMFHVIMENCNWSLWIDSTTIESTGHDHNKSVSRSITPNAFFSLDDVKSAPLKSESWALHAGKAANFWGVMFFWMLVGTQTCWAAWAKSTDADIKLLYWSFQPLAAAHNKVRASTGIIQRWHGLGRGAGGVFLHRVLQPWKILIVGFYSLSNPRQTMDSTDT